ncbi:MAG TPA: site-specific integrase [Gallionella sp.]|nr:site-specific integrase [Gallionella sp.]
MKKIEKNIYQIGPYSFQVKMMVAGMKVSKVCDTIEDARLFRDQHRVAAALDPLEAKIFEARIKKAAAKDFTFADAIGKYRTEKSEKKRGWESEGNRLDRLKRLPIAVKPLYMIHREDVLELLKDLRSGKGQQIKGVKQRSCSEDTVKRYWNLVRHIFQISVDEWRKVEKNPCDELAASERPKTGRARDRRLVGNEYDRMLDNLEGDARVVFILAVETAMRRGEILNVEWPHVDLRKRALHIPQTKTDEPRTVPLSSRAAAALQVLKKAAERSSDGKVVKMLKGRIFAIQASALRYQWRKARVAIGSPDLRLHDLRHEGASRLFERGLNVIEAAGVTGHHNLRSLRRYTHLHHADILKKLG